MKRASQFLLVVILMAAPHVPIRATALLNNVGTGSEDRRAWLVQNWDSTGTRRVSADSFFILCVGPDGDSVYSAGLDTAAATIREFCLAGDTVYSFSDLVANLDGSGSPGVYILQVRALQSPTGLSFVNVFEFQIIGIDLNAGLIDTILNKDSVVVAAFADNAITDAAIEPNAIDIDEFGGTLGASQLESNFLNSTHLDGSFAREIADTVRHDSLAYRGTGAPADVTADAVWDEIASGHTASGSFGSYLDARVSQISVGAGSGAYPCSVWVAQSDSGPYLPGIGVQVQNPSGAIVGAGLTESNGFFVAYLDNGVWPIRATATGWEIESDSFVVVGAAAYDTILATPFDPGAPAAPTLCRVYGYVFDVAGAAVTGAEVSARLVDGPARLNGYLIRPTAAAASTDTAGYFQVDLVPNALLSPMATEYEITATLPDGVMIRSVVTVPDQASWQIVW